MEVTDGETDALKTLYERMLDPCNFGVADEAAGPSDERCARPPMPATPYVKSAACDRDAAGNGEPPSLLRRFDALVTAALDSRTSGSSDSAYDQAALPDPVLFTKCKAMPPGTINTVLCGIDVERAVQGPPAEPDGLLDAVDALVKAEAGCKLGGAVRAAEMAAMAQPEAKHAEDAARIGAKAYAAAAKGEKPGGSTSETPVEVVGYVGCTRSRSPVEEKKCTDRA